MTTIKKILNEYIVLEKIGTWLPILVSAVAQFVSVIISNIYKEHPVIFWIFFGIGIISCLIFLGLVYHYIDKWHDIYSVLRKDGTLTKTCVYLSTMEKSKWKNDWFTLNSIEINYVFNEPYILQTQNGVIKEYFPFTVTYEIQGKARENCSTFFFHLLSHTNSKKDRLRKIEYSFDDQVFREATQIEQDLKNVVVYALPREAAYRQGEPVHYKIRLHFLGSAGLAVDNLSRLLFYPRNFSVHVSRSDNNAKIKLTAPKVFLQKFQKPIVHSYEDGLNENLAYIYSR